MNDHKPFALAENKREAKRLGVKRLVAIRPVDPGRPMTFGDIIAGFVAAVSPPADGENEPPPLERLERRRPDTTTRNDLG